MNALSAIAFVAEQKILEAQQEGAFDNLPGTGKPLELEDTSHIPEELRMAYTLLKNAGYIEPKASSLPFSEKDLLQTSPEDTAAHAKMRRFRFLMRRARHGSADLPCMPELEDSPYLDKLLKKV